MAAALAFLLQVTAWAWMPGMAQAAVQAASAKDSIIICTFEGMALLAPDGSKTLLGDNAAKSDDDGKAPLKSGCPICPLVAGLSLPPVLISLAMPAHDFAAAALPQHQIAAGFSLPAPQARAPPAL